MQFLPQSSTPIASTASHASIQSLIAADALCQAQILVADDEPANVLLLKRMLSNVGYENVVSAANGREAVALCREKLPDLILLDLMMPELDGFGVLMELDAVRHTQFLPVLVLTADINSETMRRSLSAGANDFVTKPFDHMEVILRVKNLLETRFLTLELRHQNAELESRVAERTRELSASYDRLALSYQELQQSRRAVEESQIEVLQRLAQAAELRDDNTGQHTRRVGELAARLAQKLELESAHVELIRGAAPLHDVGKIGVSDTILLKPGRLTRDEFEAMKSHAQIGGALLKEGHSPLMCVAQIIALTHHERFDGTGYPHGLAGENIPLEGRILAVVDVFDALTHERPYKAAWPVAQALAEIESGSGTQFDPRVATTFLAMMRDEIGSESLHSHRKNEPERHLN